MTKPHIGSVSKSLVINDKNEVLILTIGEYKAHPEKSFKPDLPGGMVDAGETELAAAVRELQEETGIIVSPDLCTFAYAKTQFFEQKNKSISRFLYVIYVPNTPEVTISWEHSSYKWVSLDTLITSVELRPFYKEAVEYCFANGLI
jgi:8-oxo-dGTP pyrophosphatase MutT (NUDIX family)